MSGSPTEADIQTQWKNAVAIIENLRVRFDTDIVGAGGKLDTLTQSLEGEYLPSDYTRLMGLFRAGCSELVSPSFASGIITPLLFEYAKILAGGTTTGIGSGYTSPGDLFYALYEWLHANGDTVQSRAITFDSSPSYKAGNVGNGTLVRLTVDQNAYPLEAVTVERKQFICRADQNSGTEKEAETFEVSGEQASFDNLQRGTYGSGDAARTTITAKHAGSGGGGSLLTNSSFSSYTASSTPKFSGWTETAGGSNISQSTTNFYRSHPNATTDASLAIVGGSGTVTLSQYLADMRVRRFDQGTPYFLRAMVNKTIGSASGGSFTIRLGAITKTVPLTSIGSGWQEVAIDLNEDCWLQNFQQDDMKIDVEWSGSTSGTLYVDDLLFCPFSLIDGSWYLIRQANASPVAWQLEDLFAIEDSGGAPGTGVLQYWLWVAGFGYLPSSGTPTITDP